MTDNDTSLEMRHPADGASPPAALVTHWSQTDPILPAGARWTALQGGRTNALWRVDAPGGAVVVKLFRPGTDTPLFRNDPDAEAQALAALAGSGLAPALRARGETALGPSLIYGHVAGRVWRPEDGVAPVARALAGLHRFTAPANLPSARGDADALRDHGRDILEMVGAPGRALAGDQPELPRSVPPVEHVFLHGDCTAGNALVADSGVTFIDWQCPAKGDPTIDLAVFLSPAMQAVSGNRPLSASEELTFLDAYGNAAVADRYHALAPLHHWRIAAYCLWRAARGDAGYEDAAKLEVERLKERTRPRRRQA